MFVVYFLLWTFLLYWIHRIVHNISLLRDIHRDHHRFISQNSVKWHWSNLFLFNDTWMSTLDLWITEVIPTAIFSLITGQIWIFLFYYTWAALFQESIEHNPNINFPLLTSGRWHLLHHRNVNKNFGLFFSIWDIIFLTNKNDTYIRK